MNDDHKNTTLQILLNPVVLIALAILIGTYALIAAAMFGWDHGVLTGMARSDFARGLITYLFAVVTIGTAVVLVVSALTSEASEEVEKRFQRGKEILSLLLGVFGTIVGFYFGSEIKSASQGEAEALRLTAPLLSERVVTGGERFTVTAAVSGGTPPYQYGILLDGGEELRYDQSVGANGWIVHKLTAPTMTEPRDFELKIGVKDAAGHRSTTSERIEITTKATTPPSSP